MLENFYQTLVISAVTGLCSFRYRSPAFHVQSWYDEVKDYTYPYPHECNPWCPDKCTGSMCTHYTQVKEPKGFCIPTLCVPPASHLSLQREPREGQFAYFQ